MTGFVTVLFALTYVGMAMGRVPGLRIDRSGIAMVAAVVLVAAEAIPSGEVLASNTIGNVPAVVMLLEIWREIPQGSLTGLAILSTLAGNLLLVGSLANLIVAERAALAAVRLSFRDHARAGIPITLLSSLLAGLWLWMSGHMPI